MNQGGLEPLLTLANQLARQEYSQVDWRELVKIEGSLSIHQIDCRQRTVRTMIPTIVQSLL